VYVTVTTPPDTAVSSPLVVLIVAIVVSLVLHVPPGVALLYIAVLPSHIWIGPVVPTGIGFTVTGCVEAQPVESVYVIVAVPIDIPVTAPVTGSTNATPGLLLPHTPPLMTLESILT
jgi:hypothetical protein